MTVLAARRQRILVAVVVPVPSSSEIAWRRFSESVLIDTVQEFGRHPGVFVAPLLVAVELLKPPNARAIQQLHAPPLEADQPLLRHELVDQSLNAQGAQVI